MKKQWISILVVALLSGCAVGPDYQQTQLKFKQKRWSKHAHSLVTSEVERLWWQQLKDPQLSRLMQQVSCQNLDVAMARSRLSQARAMQAAVYAKGGPSMAGSASVTNQQISENGPFLGLFPGGPFFGQIPTNIKVYQPGFDASWELDVFGQNFRRNQQQSAKTAAAAITVDDVTRQIRAEVARSYIQLRATQEKIDIARKNIALQKKSFRLTQNLNKVGSANDLAVSLADSQLTNTRSVLPNLEATAYSLMSQIAVLMGQHPNALLSELMPQKSMPVLPVKIAIGLPSDLLRRRPDILAAERQIAAATADIGVAVADLYPKFNLVADVSLQSLHLDTLWQQNSAAWTLGPFMQWSLFQSGQIRANIRLKEAQKQETILQYQKTVLSAIQEAEVSIHRFLSAKRTQDQLIRSVKSNRRSVNLARQRYTAGEDDILALIHSQQQLMQAQSNSVDAKASSLIELVSLYKSVGGGWA